jgi:hypothetical protein
MTDLMYVLPATTINQVVAYLSEQKYKDVAALINLLIAAQPVEIKDGKSARCTSNELLEGSNTVPLQ